MLRRERPLALGHLLPDDIGLRRLEEPLGVRPVTRHPGEQLPAARRRCRGSARHAQHARERLGGRRDRDYSAGLARRLVSSMMDPSPPDADPHNAARGATLASQARLGRKLRTAGLVALGNVIGLVLCAVLSIGFELPKPSLIGFALAAVGAGMVMAVS